MNPNKQHVIYIAHGNDHYVREAAYSIMSMWRHSPARNFGIVVVSDRPEVFKSLLPLDESIRYLPLDDSRKKEYLASLGYVHRIKPLAIAWAAKTVGAPGDAFLFLDTDTAATGDVQKLFDLIWKGKTVLNECEGTIQNPSYRGSAQRKLLGFAQNQGLRVAGQEQRLDVSTPMWNSGVLGFQSPVIALLEQSVQWIDAMFPLLGIQSVEQVACSLVLHHARTPVCDSGDTVLHYHMFKEYRADLQAFFEQVQDMSLAERIKHLDWVDPAQRIQPKLAFNRLPKWQRKLKRLVGSGWTPLPYPWLNKR